ncbi:hypothetical protein VTP01DRAFT_4237 [Rhizomucor pusillus]|uniref:uncharacterized protein n=1 Tax=Rhizomucor pusillus TaxID=4840 RepID=UPI0037427CD6
MSDLHWCTYCDNAISAFSDSLYCSEQCLRNDALRNHPLLGYDYHEFVDFPRPYPKDDSSFGTRTPTSSSPSSPALTAAASSAASSFRSMSPPKLDLSSESHPHILAARPRSRDIPPMSLYATFYISLVYPDDQQRQRKVSPHLTLVHNCFYTPPLSMSVQTNGRIIDSPFPQNS